jgi:hypothetical protein
MKLSVRETTNMNSIIKEIGLKSQILLQQEKTRNLIGS